MSRLDRLLHCTQCGTEYLVTVEEHRQQIADSVLATPAGVCPGCRVLGTLTARRLGYVKWYNPRKGYGFIQQADGTDVFLHASSVRNRKSLRLCPGQVVSYQVEQTDKGSLATEIDIAD